MQQTLSFQVVTSRITGLVVVDQHGQIVDTCPAWRRWRGQSWDVFTHQMPIERVTMFHDNASPCVLYDKAMLEAKRGKMWPQEIPTPTFLQKKEQR